MRPMAKWLLVGLLVASGNACTTVLAPERTEALGPPFNDALKSGYLQLADSRWAQGSWEALHFRDKARQAMLGDAVWPDDPASARAPAALRPQLVEHRERLLTVLDGGGRILAPQDAAMAQVGFDCWLSDARRSKRLESTCRDAFLASLQETERTLVAALPASYHVPFEPGSDRLDAVGLNVATAASRAARLREPARIRVIGYADPSGPARLNDALSLQRAENVAAVLQRAGVAPQLIEVQARGAAGAAEDGRRVEITFDS